MTPTKRPRSALDVARDYLKLRFAETPQQWVVIDEVAEHCNISKSTAGIVLSRLASAGRATTELQRSPGRYDNQRRVYRWLS